MLTRSLASNLSFASNLSLSSAVLVLLVGACSSDELDPTAAGPGNDAFVDGGATAGDGAAASTDGGIGQRGDAAKLDVRAGDAALLNDTAVGPSPDVSGGTQKQDSSVTLPPDATQSGSGADMVFVSVDPVSTTADKDTVISYTLKVRNNGPKRAPSVLISFFMPSQLRVLGGQCTGGAGFGQCSMGALNAGASLSVNGLLAGSSSGTYPFEIIVGGGTVDPNLNNNRIQSTITIR